MGAPREGRWKHQGEEDGRTRGRTMGALVEGLWENQGKEDGRTRGRDMGEPGGGRWEHQGKEDGSTRGWKMGEPGGGRWSENKNKFEREVTELVKRGQRLLTSLTQTIYFKKSEFLHLSKMVKNMGSEV